MRRSHLMLSWCLLAVVPAAIAQGDRPPPPVATVASPAFARSGIPDWSTPPPPTTEPTFTPPVAQRFKLKNGMALLVIENHELPIVSMALIVPGAGAASDPKAKGGLAAFTTDLLDEGAGGLSAIGIAEETDRLGAGITMYADVDAAYVSVNTLAKTLDPTLVLVSKLITQPAFDDTEAARVKGDRLTALELRRDRPREVAAILLNGAIFGPSSPYGHPTSGVREEFKALGVGDARAFYKQHWNPAAMTLVVAGDVDARALRNKLQAGLGAWKPVGARPPVRPIAPPAKIAHRLLLVDRPAAAQSDVRVGIIGLDRKDRRYPAFEVFRTALGEGFTSRLIQRLREQLGITYGANATMDWRLARGPFVIGTAIVTASTGQGIAETLKLVGAMSTTEVPADELEKTKQNIIRALPSRFDTNASTADAYADLALHGLPVDWYARYADRVRKVTANDVKAVARSVAPADKLVVAVVGDMAKVRADLDKLGLGVPALHDLHGHPLPGPAK